MLLQNEKSTMTLDRDRASRILYDDEPMMASNMVTTDFSNIETEALFNNNHNFNEYNTLVESSYAEEIQTQTVELPRFEQYYNDTNPLPMQQHQSYRPNVLADFPELIQAQDQKIATQFDEALMEKIAETEVVEIAKAVDTTQESTEAYLRLNAKGLIAVVTFFAVTALIIALVIINGVAIGSGAATIDALQVENTQLTAVYSEAMSDRNAAFSLGATEAGGTGSALLPGQTITLPPATPIATSTNPDHATNLFDQIVRFLTSIFR